MIFEWDEQKNVANYAKHHVTFEVACLVFEDPHQLLVFDRTIDGEERWKVIGTVKGRRVMVVVHTYRGSEETEIIRIISARRANSHERRNYEND